MAEKKSVQERGGALDAGAEIERALRCASTGWSLGCDGALAEFLRDPDEHAHFERNRDAGELAVTTPRGGIRARLHGGIRPIAYESPREGAPGWRNGVSFCLPTGAAFMSGRSVVTEIGADRSSLRRCDRDAVLFDLGLGVPHIEACVRTRDAALVDALRRHRGRPLLEHGGSLTQALIRAGPPRVFRSRLGRIEVYQPIPTDVTPDGPHTHFLPERLVPSGARRAAAHVPDCHVVCLDMYWPPVEAAARCVAFDGDEHLVFQRWLDAWGEPEYVHEKDRAQAALAAGEAASAFQAPRTRMGSRAVRIAIRQWRRLHGPSRLLDEWRERFDPEPRGREET